MFPFVCLSVSISVSVRFDDETEFWTKANQNIRPFEEQHCQQCTKTLPGRSEHASAPAEDAPAEDALAQERLEAANAQFSIDLQMVATPEEARALLCNRQKFFDSSGKYHIFFPFRSIYQ